MFSPAKVEEGGHSIPDWNSGNTGVPCVPFCGLAALGKRKGLLHSPLEEIRSSERKQATHSHTARWVWDGRAGSPRSV